MANLSKIKRDKMIRFINVLREEHKTDDNILIALNEIENEITRKKYGLVFEEHDEAVDTMMQNNIPVLTEKKELEIETDTTKPYNFIIEGDNLHSLVLLEKALKERVDVIYIDPPYNTGARDWKYNNDYVDGFDFFRHSKWLSFMQRRLQVAKKLLTKQGVMVVAIDDYEYSHLYMLLEDLFSEYDLYTVIVNHHPQGGAAGNVTRTHEYAIFVIPKGMVLLKGEKSENVEATWSLMRGGKDLRNLRVGRPRSFYAIFVDPKTREVKGVGPALKATDPYSTEPTKEGYIPLYPVGKDGTERVWRYERSSMIQHIENNEIVCSEQMSLGVIKKNDVKYAQVPSLWIDPKYNAGINGTNLLSTIFGGSNTFAYPKSLFTVLDTIKYLTQENKDAIIVDFFAGSGTTGHAVLQLNEDDGGNRRFILCTNNENNICQEITYPRCKTIITGKRSDGSEYSSGIPANLKYYITDFVSKDEEFLSEALLTHIEEMIQIEHGIKIDGKKHRIILTDEEADKLEKEWNSGSGVESIYVSKNVLFTTEQSRLFNTVDVYTIPDYYFNFEMKETGESW